MGNICCSSKKGRRDPQDEQDFDINELNGGDLNANDGGLFGG